LQERLLFFFFLYKNRTFSFPCSVRDLSQRSFLPSPTAKNKSSLFLPFFTRFHMMLCRFSTVLTEERIPPPFLPSAAKKARLFSSFFLCSHCHFFTSILSSERIFFPSSSPRTRDVPCTNGVFFFPPPPPPSLDKISLNCFSLLSSPVHYAEPKAPFSFFPFQLSRYGAATKGAPPFLLFFFSPPILMTSPFSPQTSSHR